MKKHPLQKMDAQVDHYVQKSYTEFKQSSIPHKTFTILEWILIILIVLIANIGAGVSGLGWAIALAIFIDIVFIGYFIHAIYRKNHRTKIIQETVIQEVPPKTPYDEQ